MKLVHDVWWTFFCQEPRSKLKCQGVCQTWKEWDMLKQIYTRHEKQWIWKHVCWLGNIKCIQKWEDLDVVPLHFVLFCLHLSKWNYGLVKACQGGHINIVDYMVKRSK